MNDSQCISILILQLTTTMNSKILIFLFLNTFAHGKIIFKDWSLTDTVGELTPIDPFGMVGQILNMECKLNTSDPFLEGKYNASDIYFEINREPVLYDDPAIHIVNETTAVLTLNTTLDYHKSFITCLFNKSNGDMVVVGSQYMYVGWKIKEINITSIYIEDWKTLKFAWQKEINPIYVTKIWSWWKLGHKADSWKQCTYNRESLKKSWPSICIVENFYPNLTREEQLGNISIKINASHIAEKMEFGPKTFSIPDLIRPAPPINVMAMNVSDTSMKVEWIYPKVTHHDDYLNLTYIFKVEYYYSVNDIYSIMTQNSSLTLFNLIPLTNYTITVRCKVQHGKQWSEAIQISALTLPSPQIVTLPPQIKNEFTLLPDENIESKSIMYTILKMMRFMSKVPIMVRCNLMSIFYESKNE